MNFLIGKEKAWASFIVTGATIFGGAEFAKMIGDFAPLLQAALVSLSVYLTANTEA